MNSLLLVIDMQEAFINENTEHLIEKVEKLIHSNHYDYVVFTRHDHSPGHLYGSWNWRNHPDNLWGSDCRGVGYLRYRKAYPKLTKLTPGTEVETRPLPFSRNLHTPL